MKYPRAMDEIKLNLVYIHQCLIHISYFNRNSFAAEETMIEDFAFLELIDGKWGKEILLAITFKKLKVFRNQWIDYKRKFTYSDNVVFMFYDKNWREIVSKYLIPALEKMEEDFNRHGIEYNNFRAQYDPDSRPNDSDIISAANVLYNLLLKNKIIEKSYLNE